MDAGSLGSSSHTPVPHQGGWMLGALPGSEVRGLGI